MSNTPVHVTLFTHVWKIFYSDLFPYRSFNILLEYRNLGLVPLVYECLGHESGLRIIQFNFFCTFSFFYYIRNCIIQ